MSPRMLISRACRENFATLLILAAVPFVACAQDSGGKPEKSIESPSPNGRYAFLLTETADQKTCDLIEKRTGKVLLQVGQSDDDSNELEVEVLWASDSKRFAVTRTYHNRRLNELGVYLRADDAFAEVDLPDLPEATLPEKLAHDQDHFWHINVLDFITLVRWSKDGSLQVEIETSNDGNGSFATAKRTVVLGFDHSKATIVRSSQKVTSHIEPSK